MGKMIGFAVFDVHEDWVDFVFAKYSTKNLKLRVSDAINVTALEYYLNEMQRRYVSDGQRSILHKTNVQDYLIDHFGYRKAYCRLHLRYRKRLKYLIEVLYPVRMPLRWMDGINKIHQLNSLLLMEKIVRMEK